MTLEDLPYAWRDAHQAAELAARLADEATAAVDMAAPDGSVLQELEALVVFAEAAAASAERAAETARRCAAQARERASLALAELPGAQQAAADASTREDRARDRYQEAARDAFARRERPAG